MKTKLKLATLGLLLGLAAVGWPEGEVPTVRIGILERQSKVQITCASTWEIGPVGEGPAVIQAQPNQTLTLRLALAAPAAPETPPAAAYLGSQPAQGGEGEIQNTPETPATPPAPTPAPPAPPVPTPPPPLPALPVPLTPPQKQLEIVDDTGKVLATIVPPVRIHSTGDGLLKVAGTGQGHWDKIDLREFRGEIRLVWDSHGLLSVINLVDLESYLRGVVASEMLSSYPLEALKAQSICARSEALATLKRHERDGFDLCSTVHCQVYGGKTSETANTDQAVQGTRGQVIMYQGKIAHTVYSAVCGGHTEDNENVWGGPPVAYLRGHPDGDPAKLTAYHFPLQGDELRRYVTQAPLVNCYIPKWTRLDVYRWVRVIERAKLEASLSEVDKVGTLMELNPLERGSSGRITRLEVKGTENTFTLSPELTIRRALGGSSNPLRSSCFVVDSYSDSQGVPVVFIFWGAGWGHGSGMCQVGAVGLADQGKTAPDILAFYFPSTTLEARY